MPPGPRPTVAVATAAAPTYAEGQEVPLSVTLAGSLRSGGGGGGSITEFAEDSAHSSGDLGNMALAVRNDADTSLVDTDGDYGSLQLDSLGRLKVNVVAGSSAGTEFDEDTPHTTGDAGVQVLAVRNDSEGTLVSTDGDYASLQLDGSGRLRTVINDGGAVISVDDAGGSLTVDNATLSVVGGGLEATALRVTIASDSTGLLSVDDNGGSLTVDNAALAVTGGGVEATALRVTMASDSTGVLSVDDNGGTLSVDDGGGTLTVDQLAEHVEDTAHSTGDTGIFTLAVRNDADTSLVGTDGDYAPVQVDSLGRLKVNVVAGSAGGTEFNEDTAHTTGDAGTQVLAVRNDVEGTLVSTDGDYASLQLDGSGRLRTLATTNYEYAEDSAHTSTETGAFVLAVRRDANTTPVSADGDYAPLIQDATGNLKVNVVAGSAGGTEFNEDTAHTTGDAGTQVLAVRNDVEGTLVSTDGDYASLQLDGSGRLRTVINDGGGTITVDNAALSVTGGGVEATALRVTIASDSTGLLAVDDNGGSLTVDQLAEHVEDTAHSTGETGIMGLAVRRDADTSLVDTDGDYAPLQVNATGQLKTAVVGVVSVDDNGGSLTVDNSTLAVVGGGTEATAMRVTIASDSTGLLSVDDNGGSLTVDNASLSVTGGGTEASAMRVTIANDSTGLLSVDDNGGSLTVDDGGTALLTEGPDAHDAAVSGNPYVVAARASEDEPSAVSADGDVVRIWGDRVGRIVTLEGHADPEPPDNTNATASGETTLIAAGGASTQLVIKKGSVFNADSSTVRVELRDGSAGTVRWTGFLAADGGGARFDFGSRGWELTANTALVGNLSGAGDVEFNVEEYYIMAT